MKHNRVVYFAGVLILICAFFTADSFAAQPFPGQQYSKSKVSRHGYMPVQAGYYQAQCSGPMFAPAVGGLNHAVPLYAVNQSRWAVFGKCFDVAIAVSAIPCRIVDCLIDKCTGPRQLTFAFAPAYIPPICTPVVSQPRHKGAKVRHVAHSY